MDSEEIADAIEQLLFHKDELEQMSKHAMQAAADCCNWDLEEKKLFYLYEKLRYS
jgi:hypothetical protein